MGILNLFKSNASQAVSRATVQEVEPNSASGQAGVHEVKAMDTATYLASDEKDWVRYLSQPIRPYRKPGVSVKEEHDQWRAARERQRALAS